MQLVCGNYFLCHQYTFILLQSLQQQRNNGQKEKVYLLGIVVHKYRTKLNK